MPTDADSAFYLHIVVGQLGASTEVLDRQARFVEEHNIHPTVAKVYKFQDAREAFADFMGQKTVGKIVITTD